jgi:hypothetical protein
MGAPQALQVWRSAQPTKPHLLHFVLFILFVLVIGEKEAGLNGAMCVGGFAPLPFRKKGRKIYY